MLLDGATLHQLTKQASSGQRDYETWRTSRKLMVQHFSMATCEKEYAFIQEAEGIQLLYDFMHKPDEIMEHPMRYATSSLTSIS